MKNLVISTESIIEILRPLPQNDITTQFLSEEGEGGQLNIFTPRDLLVGRTKQDSPEIL